MLHIESLYLQILRRRPRVLIYLERESFGISAIVLCHKKSCIVRVFSSVFVSLTLDYFSQVRVERGSKFVSST